jgi:hypothetical protein
MDSCMVCVKTKHNNKRKRSICSIIVLTWTLVTFLKLVMKCDNKVANANKTPNIKIRRKWNHKIWPNNQCFYIYPSRFIKSQCIYLYPLLRTSYATFIQYIPFETPSTHLLLDIKNPPNCNRSYPFLVWVHFHGCYRSKFTIPHTIHHDWTLKTQLIRFVK